MSFLGNRSGPRKSEIIQRLGHKQTIHVSRKNSAIRNSDEEAKLLEVARKGISRYLDRALAEGRLDQQLYADAMKRTFGNVEEWLSNQYLEQVRPGSTVGLREAIQKGKWESIVNAFRQSIRFGTGGIRGMMAFDKRSIETLNDKGLQAPILKGPNTINDVLLLRTSAGVAKFGREQNPRFEKIVIGYDSRVRGHDLAAIVAQLFLRFDYTVYFFDAPCPYPEVTFAIPYRDIQADMGILISASHNDYRYNGYKLSCANGSQFDPVQRRHMFDQYIDKAQFEDIKLREFRDAPQDKLWFLGGDRPVPDFDYIGRESKLINIHDRHLAHVRSFLLTENLPEQQRNARDPLKIGYCAFHGAGRIAVPRLLEAVGFNEPQRVTWKKLNELNGLFPSFHSEPGREQQPDPGDIRAASVAVEGFETSIIDKQSTKDHPGDFKSIDILVGTDPDADRCGIVVKVPPKQRALFTNKYSIHGTWTLLPADDAWTLLLWYRLNHEIQRHGHVVDADKKFVVLSITTSDAVARIARKYGIGVIKTWVGFASLAAATELVWNGQTGQIIGLKDGRDPTAVQRDPGRPIKCHEVVCDTEDMDNGRRSFNIAAMEQSNGFSLLGGPPPNKRSLGVGGHVRDKDGTLAALLMTEVAAWAKERGTTLIELLDRHIYLDPDIGLYCNLYEPDPMDGEYPGIEGDRRKKAILRRALSMMQQALVGDLKIGGKPVKTAVIYRTEKYDANYPATQDFVFPDEGIRFFFDDERNQHVTIRPSGTGNSLRFHVQLHAYPKKSNLIATKKALRKQGEKILDDVRKQLKAPRTNK